MKVPQLILGQVINVHVYTNIKFIGFVGTKKAKQKFPLKMSAHNNMLFINCIKYVLKWMNILFDYLTWMYRKKRNMIEAIMNVHYEKWFVIATK